MKKNVKAMALAAALILGGAFILGCSDDDDDDDDWISYNEIPETAQKAIETSFGKLDTINDIKKDDDSYEIHLKDGTKIDFDWNGKWKEIDNNAGIDAKYFGTDAELKQIKEKVIADASLKDKTIVEVDRELVGFKVEFSDKTEKLVTL